MRQPGFEFLRLSKFDLEMLHEWLNRPHVVARWGGSIVLSDAIRKYLPRITDQSDAHPYIARIDSVPTGFIQYYWALKSGADSWAGPLDERTVGIDYFLADSKKLGQGLGSAMVSEFSKMLFSTGTISRIISDPAIDNIASIRCLEKAGFRRLRQIDSADGAAMLMERLARSL